MVSHIAIDLDGTLLDSVGDLHAAVVLMQQSLSCENSSLDDVRKWIGNGVERLVHRALTGTTSENAEPEQFDIALDLFKQAYREVNGQNTSIYPGVVAGLQQLAETGIPLSVVTNKSREFTEPLLVQTSLDTYFSHIVCGDDVAQKKPAPDALLRSAALLNIMPSSCVLVGDSINDFRAAHRAGFKAVGVRYGYNHGIELSTLQGIDKPDVLIDSLEELPLLVSEAD